nr:hypothetical protein CFP56_11288 [Quercus suber]
MSSNKADFRSEVESFATEYAGIWSTAKASKSDGAPEVAKTAADHYRPGFTFFTNGQIERFESRDEAATLMKGEMRAGIDAGVGVHMTLKNLRVEIVSKSSALCWITFVFHPAAGSGHDEWSFENVYGYRAESEGVAAGFEFVIRDQEASGLEKMTAPQLLMLFTPTSSLLHERYHCPSISTRSKRMYVVWSQSRALSMRLSTMIARICSKSDNWFVWVTSVFDYAVINHHGSQRRREARAVATALICVWSGVVTPIMVLLYG